MTVNEFICKDRNYIIIFVNFLLLSVLIILGQIKNIDKQIPESILETTNVYSALKGDVETFARSDARNMAKGIGECINKEISNGTGDIYKIIFNCGAYHRSGGENGDFFVFDRITKKMIYDGSPDCMKGGTSRIFDNIFERNFTGANQGECWMHNDRSACIDAINNLYNIGNTNSFSSIWWKFDNNVEWLESYVIPSTREGFRGIVGSGGIYNNNTNSQLQIVMGTKENEVMNSFIRSNEKYKIALNNKIELLNTLVNYVRLIVCLMIIMAFTNVIVLKTK